MAREEKIGGGDMVRFVSYTCFSYFLFPYVEIVVDGGKF